MNVLHVALPYVSVIISVYNQRRFIPKLLHSLANQTIAAPYEVIVCDDGSCDATLEEIRSLAIIDGLDVRYIWQPDQGFRLSRSRNNAIRCAQGALLVFLDGDTWVSDSFLADHLCAHSEDRLLVCGSRRHLSSTREVDVCSQIPFEELLSFTESKEVIAQRAWLSSERPWMMCIGGNFSVRKGPEILFDEEFIGWGSEDRDIALRLYRLGYQPRLIETSHAIHLLLPEHEKANMTHEQIIASIYGKLHLRKKYPAGEMEESIGLVRYCHLSAADQKWQIGPLRSDSVDDVFHQFECWLECNGRL